MTNDSLSTFTGKLPTTPQAWAFSLAEACNAAAKAKVMADTETFLPALEAIIRQSTLPYEEVLTDHRRLVRELDVALNGELGAANQASLCDIVAQVKTHPSPDTSLIEKLEAAKMSVPDAQLEEHRFAKINYNSGLEEAISIVRDHFAQMVNAPKAVLDAAGVKYHEINELEALAKEYHARFAKNHAHMLPWAEDREDNKQWCRDKVSEEWLPIIETYEAAKQSAVHQESNSHCAGGAAPRKDEGDVEGPAKATSPNIVTTSPAPDRYNAEPVLHQSLNLSEELREKVTEAMATVIRDMRDNSNRDSLWIAQAALAAIEPYVAAWRAGE